MSDIAPSGDKIPVIVRGTSLAKAREALAASPGAEIKDELSIVNGFTAEIDPREVRRLQRAGLQVTVDEKVRMVDPLIQEPRDESIFKLDNAVATLGVNRLWDRGFRGQGVGIAIVDTGIHPHPDLRGRIVAFKDYVRGQKAPYDDQGHGTHVAGDAAGDGTASGGKFVGTAPAAKLVGIKVLDKDGAGRFSDIIKGIQWAVRHKDEYNIRVLNMSLGGPILDSYKDDPVAQAAARAAEAGIVPVIAAGNAGPRGRTIGSPGNHPDVLTVGALDDKGTVARDDDEVAKFSSRGPTELDGVLKPDVLSPGVLITAANAPGSALDRHPKVPHVGDWYISISGTSMATPVMAGIVADILSANPSLTPQQVKEILTTTARPLEHDPPYGRNDQGAGVVNPEEALDQALTLLPESDHGREQNFLLG